MRRFLLMILFMIIIVNIVSCNIQKSNQIKIPDNIDKQLITSNITFNIWDEINKPIKGAKIIVIDGNGSVLSSAISNEAGQIEQKITVPLDERFYWEDPDKMEPRGTVMVIAYKQGYKELVVFEIPVSSYTPTQNIYMNRIAEGERNEPDIKIANIHHLEIISLVRKYQNYFN